MPLACHAEIFLKQEPKNGNGLPPAGHHHARASARSRCSCTGPPSPSRLYACSVTRTPAIMQEVRAPLWNFLALESTFSTSTRPNYNPIADPVADKGHPTNPTTDEGSAYSCPSSACPRSAARCPRQTLPCNRASNYCRRSCSSRRRRRDRRALRISSSGSRLRTLYVIIFKNSSQPMMSDPSPSTSEIMF